jgi:TRAP-type C4-dicarboxylate transport system permease small subunit
MVHGLSREKAGLAAQRIGKWIERVCGFFCVICFASMTVVTLLGVFFRYVMQSPFMWTEEVARYLLVWLGFTAVSLAFWQNKHIKVDILSQFLPRPLATLIDYFIDLLVALFMIVLLHQGYLMTVNSIMKASTFNLSMKWVLLVVPLAAFVTLVFLVLRAVRKLSGEIDTGNPLEID